MTQHDTPTTTDERLAYDLAGLAHAIGVSRSTVIRLLNNGSIAAKKLGSRTVILREEAERYMRSLPSASKGSKP